MLDKCLHPGKAFYRKPWRTGTGCHVLEWCPTCRANVRGAGIWVGDAELIALDLDRNTLPVLPDASPQPGLFDGGESS
jgi:hypothetical protein